MTTDAVESQENQQQEAQQEVDQDAFEAAFSQARGDEPPAETPPANEEQNDQAQVAEATEASATEPEAKATEQEAATTEEQSAPEADDDKPVFAGLSARQLKEAIAKASEVDKLKESIASNHDKVFGKFGELQRVLNDLQKAKAPGQQVKLTGAMFKHMSEEFGKEFAEKLAEDLSELQITTQGGFDQSQVDQIVSEKLAESRKELDERGKQIELKLLTIAHPDWYENRHSPDFAIWLTTLPPEIKERVETSQDSVFLTKAFTGFKAWKQAADEATKKAADEQVEAAKQKNGKRLADAITPSGVPASGPPQLTEEDAFVSGFKGARGGG